MPSNTMSLVAEASRLLGKSAAGISADSRIGKGELMFDKTIKRLLIAVVTATSLTGCASIIVGTHAWFERKEPRLQRRAMVDLPCPDQPIAFISVSPSGHDYREVEARGCGRKVRYTYLKIGPSESWPKSSDSSAL